MAKAKKEVKETPKASKTIQRYVHFEKVGARKKEGWKEISKPNDQTTKVINRNGGDLVLMEKKA